MRKIWKFVQNIMKFVLRKVFRLNVTDNQLNQMMQLVKFGIVGLSNTLISYGVYIILIAFSWHYLVANLAGFFVSVINAFYWNNKYVFKSEKEENRIWWVAFIKTFMSYAGTGLILNNCLLIMWVEIFHLHKTIGPIINVFITVPINYLLNKYWAFNR